MTALAAGAAAGVGIRVVAGGRVAAHLPLLAVLWGAAALGGALLSWAGYGGRDVPRWERGAAGERRTAVLLERLRPPRWVVRHDLRIPGSRANIDHVIVGRTGIWVVDTKTTRAPVRARFGRVHFGERRLDTSSVRWEADVVADRLAGRLAAGLPTGQGDWPEGRVRRLVRPVVAVHGTGLRRRGSRCGGVRVVAAGDLRRTVRRGRRRLSRREVAMVAASLDRVLPAAGPDPGPTPGPGWTRGAPARLGAGGGSRV